MKSFLTRLNQVLAKASKAPDKTPLAAAGEGALEEGVRAISPSVPAKEVTSSSPQPVATSSVQPICLFFEAHQPNRLKPYSFFDIGTDPFYEDDALNRHLLNELCDKAYLPANELMTRLIEEGKGQFCISLSLSGVLIEQLEKHRPEVLSSFQRLYATGGVEMVAETYYHSLGFHRSKEEFRQQVELQLAKLDEVFGAKPKAFRHTACVYYNELAAFVEGMGFESMLGEAVGHILGGREANRLYRSPNCSTIKAHLRNGILSDDVAFRFGKPAWPQHPLTAEKFATWCQTNGGEVVNLFMDYECLGKHQDASTGIFEFFQAFPAAWEHLGGRFVTISQAASELEVAGIYDCHEPTSWADAAKDLSPWKGNAMQEEARRKILIIEKQVKSKNNPELLHQWRKMQTAEHFYYMSTKGGEEGQVHARQRPYPSPYDAYLYFMNALTDLQIRLEED